MSFQKCPACDGYGNRPHRTKPGRLAKCRPCEGRGVLWFADVNLLPVQPATAVPPVTFMPYIPPHAYPDPSWPYTPVPMFPPAHPDVGPSPIVPWPWHTGTISVDCGVPMSGVNPGDPITCDSVHAEPIDTWRYRGFQQGTSLDMRNGSYVTYTSCGDC